MKADARPLGRPTNTQTQLRKEKTIMQVAFIFLSCKTAAFSPPNTFPTRATHTVARYDITESTHQLSFALSRWRNLARFAGSHPDKTEIVNDGSSLICGNLKHLAGAEPLSLRRKRRFHDCILGKQLTDDVIGGWSEAVGF